jgi:segregation and condensation protein B
MTTDAGTLQRILEAALLAAARPLDLDELLALFPEQERPDRAALRDALGALREQYAGHAMELHEVASGYRVQIRSDYTPWVSRLWEERPPRYSRALLETLAIIAYRQPITRAEIEDVRGVGLSTNIFRTLLDRRWIRAVGHRDVPGRPALYGTTREFLDYFGLKSLDELPPLAELRDVDELSVALELGLAEPTPREDSAATVTDLRSYRNAGEREPAMVGSDDDASRE